MEWAKYKALQAENAELKREIELLGKVSVFFAAKYRYDYYAFIWQEKANYKIDWMCQQRKVPRSSYYRWTLPKEPTPTQVRHNELTVELKRVFGREKAMAGRDQITTILDHEGVPVAPWHDGCHQEKAGPPGGPDAGVEEDPGR